MKFIKHILIGSVLLALVFLFSVQAHATATIRLNDGSTILDIVDGDSNDSNGAAGVVTYSGDFGVFDISVTTGITKPALGSATSPELDLNQVAITCVWDLGCTGGTYTLTTMFSDIGFGPLSFSQTAITTVGGTSDGTTSFNSYYGTTIFDTSNTLGILGPYVAGSPDAPFSGATNSSFSPSGTFSLTSKATVTHSAAGENTSFNLNVNVVPEPISSTLFIVGGATLGFRRFRKNFKK